METKKNPNLIFYPLSFLLCFLVFSSWLISLTGFAWISLLRDLLVLIILVFAFFSRSDKKLFRTYYIPAILFVIWALLSFFWREASIAQWAKGARFLVLPLILFISLQWVSFSETVINKISKTIIISSSVVVFFSVLELFGVNVPLTTVLSGSGSLEANQMVGSLNIARVSSILAGPNALGLYLLVLVALSLRISEYWNKKFSLFLTVLYSVLLVLTFSRSALLGLVLLFFTLLMTQVYRRKNIILGTLTGLFILFTLLGSSYVIYQNPKTRDLLTHYSSSSLRVEQYQRVWDQRYEIGLLGRGTGTAGPSSQFRLDNGENHWTENVYLDAFEELGLIGLLLYLFVVISVLILSYRKMNTDISSRIVLLLSLSFLVTGIFINYYTGQVAIFLFWILSGLTLKEQYGKNTD